MTVRIVAGTSDPDAARALLGLLGQLPGAEPAPAVHDSTALLDLLARAAETGVEELPEVVVVHETIGPMPALDLVRDIALRFPAVGVILLTPDPGPAVLAAAMNSGARGVVGLPLSYDELGARVDAAATWAAGVRRHLGPQRAALPAVAGGTVVAVAGAKGGVGTTVTAVHLALAAHASGRSTALVDLDLQGGDIASYLDVQFRRSVADLADIADVSSRVLHDAMYVHESGPALLLAPADGERGEDVTDRAARLVLAALRQRYEVVVVDCGTQMTSANAAAVEVADTAVLVTTPDVVAVRAAKRMVRMWDRLQIRKPQDTTTVVNRHTRATEIQPTLVGRITGTRIAASTVPAAFRELQPVIDAGRLHDLDARSTVKAGIWSLAGELGLVTGASLPAPRGKKSRRGGDRGQVTLETLGMTPIILITLILVWQAVLTGYTFTLAGNAADQAARAAAVSSDPQSAGADAAASDLPGAWSGDAHTDAHRNGDGTVEATVTLKVPVLFPGTIDFPFHVHGHAKTVDERPTR
ncbi:AAA family ATPase [Actinacidiphila bryophytorum]|uniref:Pilus assembly protein CpaE n=1 Tax=Actinacidiphila bryophytorum TaxID=1436133 RepID=A0A9W4E263_9ACTN|nr:P-loop NTPase [Actinacidiphila bryophytorum]MBM9436365.1 AAA family ATPase [Actinacidiphila bryophytorum]MBN6544328.1 AAA family ATPase [Actinacidiphila bryophytorum]CAG7602446.1 Pilus assembly protein CpaE [Actinacidiphila bryophytorum]